MRRANRLSWNDGGSSHDLLEEKVVSQFGGIATGVEQLVGCTAEDVVGDEVVAALAEDSDRVFHRRLLATIDDRVVGDSAADAVFEFETLMQRVEDLAVGDSAITATDERHRCASFW